MAAFKPSWLQTQQDPDLRDQNSGLRVLDSEHTFHVGLPPVLIPVQKTGSSQGVHERSASVKPLFSILSNPL